MVYSFRLSLRFSVCFCFRSMSFRCSRCLWAINPFTLTTVGSSGSWASAAAFSWRFAFRLTALSSISLSSFSVGVHFDLRILRILSGLIWKISAIWIVLISGICCFRSRISWTCCLDSFLVGFQFPYLLRKDWSRFTHIGAFLSCSFSASIIFRRYASSDDDNFENIRKFSRPGAVIPFFPAGFIKVFWKHIRHHMPDRLNLLDSKRSIILVYVGFSASQLRSGHTKCRSTQSAVRRHSHLEGYFYEFWKKLLGHSLTFLLLNSFSLFLFFLFIFFFLISLHQPLYSVHNTERLSVVASLFAAPHNNAMKTTKVRIERKRNKFILNIYPIQEQSSAWT